MIITNSRYALVGYFITSYPTRAHGIIVKYVTFGKVLDEFSASLVKERFGRTYTADTGPDFHTTNTGNIAHDRTLIPTSQKKKNRRIRSNNSSNSPEEQKETVISLSTAQLSNTEIKLLSRGLTFVPTPKRTNWSETQADINDFARRLRLKEFFQNNQANSTNPSDEVRKRFRCKGTWAPPNGRDAALDAFISAVENDIMSSKPRPIRNNLSRKERKALPTLRKRTDIVIKPADKGSGTVIMNHSWYVNECDRLSLMTPNITKTII